MSHCIWTQEWASSFRGILQTTSNLFSEHLTSMIGVKCMVFTEFQDTPFITWLVLLNRLSIGPRPLQLGLYSSMSLLTQNRQKARPFSCMHLQVYNLARLVKYSALTYYKMIRCSHVHPSSVGVLNNDISILLKGEQSKKTSPYSSSYLPSHMRH